MKRKFTFLIAAMALMIAIMGSGATAWGQTYTWTRVTSVSELTSGGTFIMGYEATANSGTIVPLRSKDCNATTTANGYFNTGTTSGSSTNGTITMSSVSSTSDYEIFVSASTNTSGAINIQLGSNSGNFIGATSGGSSKNAGRLYTSGNSAETDIVLTYSSTNKNFKLSSPVTGSYKYLKYNTGSPRFAYYNSEGDKVVFYKKTISGYTVTYDCNGGTDGCPENQSGISGGTEITLPAAPTKGCNTFAGWNDGTNTYNAGATYTVNADVTMTAQWTPITYPITYKANGGTGDDVIKNKTCGVDYTIADNEFTHTMTFTKWNTQADGEGIDYLAGATYSTDAALTLYAQWTSATLYTVMYECNGATSGCPEPDIFNMEAGDLTLATAPEKTGFTFNGWNDGTSTYAAGDIYYVTEDVTFTAQWLENLTAPTFNVTGVSTGAANTYYATASVEISQSQEATIYYTTDGTTPTTSSTEYTEAIVVNTTGTTVIKALAVKDGYANSTVAEQTIIIVQPNVAEFTDGVYSETFESSLGLWSAFNIAGTNVWSQGTVTVYSVDYKGANINGYQASDHDWLVSPKMVAKNGKLVIDFETAARYKLTSGNEGYKLAVKYSTDYVGYGNPTTYTWTALNPTIATPTSGSIVTAESGDVVISGLANNAEVYVAFIYTSGSSSGQATQYIISNFEAKQCYPVSYDANGGDGEMEDEDSPYAVGSEVTVMANGFTAPTGSAFEKWNTQADGSGTDYMPAATFDMGTSAVTLFAQWSAPCLETATMAATTAEYEYINDEGSLSYNINLGSSVSVLGGCDIYEYGYVYSTTEATPTLENGTKIQVGTTYETAETPFEATAIENATLGTTYYVRSFATNNAGTAYSAVAQVTIPEAYPSYTISYSTNGTAETPAVVYQGNAIGALPTPTAANIPNGYVFRGWSANDITLTDDEPTYVTAETIPTDNMDLKAVFAIASEGNLVETELSINTGNFTEITTDYTQTYTHVFTEATIEAYGVYKNAGIQMNKGKGTYIKNTTAMPGYISKFVLTWSASGKNSVTMYANASSVASTSSDDLGKQLNTVTIQTIDITNASTKAYKYFYLDGTTVTGACVMTNLSVFYMAPTTTYSNFCTSVSTPEIPSTLTEDITIPTGTAVSLTSPVTIPSGKTMTVNGALGNSNPANLIIEDGGQLILNNAGVQATVKKKIEVETTKESDVKWYTISSPLTTNTAFANVTNLIPGKVTDTDYDLYRLNEAEGKWENSRIYDTDGETVIANPDFTTIDKGRGYIYSNRASSKTNVDIAFAGEINIEGIDCPLTYGAANGYNLIGNPFTQNIKFTDIDAEEGDLADGFYVLSNENTWGAKLTSADIKPLQGFLVQATKAGDVTITKPTGTSKDERSEDNANIEVIVSNSRYSDNAYAMFSDGIGLNKIDHRNAEAPMLYIPQDGADFAIACMSENTTVFPVSFKAMTTGSYTISLKANAKVKRLVLVDNMTGIETDMLVEDGYTFIGSPSDKATRFTVKLELDNANGSDNDAQFAYQNGNELIINGEGTLQLFDVLGRIVMSKEVHGYTVNVGNLSKGAYIVRMTGESVMTQKIVIR